MEATLQSVGWGLQSSLGDKSTLSPLLRDALDPLRTVRFSVADANFTVVPAPARPRKGSKSLQGREFPRKLLAEAAAALDFCLATFPPIDHRWEEFKFQFVQRYEGEPTPLASALDIWSLVASAKVTEVREDHILLPALLDALAANKAVRFPHNPNERSQWSELASGAVSFRLARNLVNRQLPVIVVDACAGPFASTFIKPTGTPSFSWEADHKALVALESAHCVGRTILDLRDDIESSSMPRLYVTSRKSPEATPIAVDDIDVAITRAGVELRMRADSTPLAVRVDASGQSVLETFLRAASQQETSLVRNFWGSLAQSPKLTRLWYGNVLLCPARFGLCWEGQSVADLRRQLDARGAPRKLVFIEPNTSERSNRIATTAEIRERLAEQGEVVLEEALDCVELSTKKMGATTFVLPFLYTTGIDLSDNSAAPPPRRPQPLPSAVPDTTWISFLHEPECRRFFPTSSVLDLRVEGTAEVLNEILLACATRLESDDVNADAWLKRWLFVLPGGAKSELRLRFFLAGDSTQRVAASRESCHQLLASLLAERQASIHNASFATYVRELPRYGGIFGVCFAEVLFALDTQASISMLRAASDIRQADMNRERARAYMAGALFVTSLFQFPPEHACSVFEEGFDGHLDAEIEDDVARASEREADYVSELVSEFAALCGGGSLTASFNPYVLAYSNLLTEFRAWRAGHTAAYLANALEPVPHYELILSIVHMHASRVFDRDLRRQEAVYLGVLSTVLRRFVEAARLPTKGDEDA